MKQNLFDEYTEMYWEMENLRTQIKARMQQIFIFHKLSKQLRTYKDNSVYKIKLPPSIFKCRLLDRSNLLKNGDSALVYNIFFLLLWVNNKFYIFPRSARESLFQVTFCFHHRLWIKEHKQADKNKVRSWKNFIMITFIVS